MEKTPDHTHAPPRERWGAELGSPQVEYDHTQGSRSVAPRCFRLQRESSSGYLSTAARRTLHEAGSSLFWFLLSAISNPVGPSRHSSRAIPADCSPYAPPADREVAEKRRSGGIAAISPSGQLVQLGRLNPMMSRLSQNLPPGPALCNPLKSSSSYFWRVDAVVSRTRKFHFNR